MLIVGEELNLSHAARMLLKVRYELTRTDLPDADLTFHTTGADELTALCQTD